MKIKVSYQQIKGRRINRFYRSGISFENWSNGIDNELLEFSNNNETIYVRKQDELNRLRQGLICYSVSNFENHSRSSRLNIKAGTVKSAIRKLRKIGRFFPNNTEWTDFAGYIKYGVSFIIKHEKSDKLFNHEESCKSLSLGIKYKALSGIKYFDNLVNELRSNGFFVSVHKEKEYDKDRYYYIANIKGFGIRASFATPNNSTYSTLNGKVAADPENCFDKWSRCDTVLNIPKSKKEINSLLETFKTITHEYDKNI